MFETSPFGRRTERMESLALADEEAEEVIVIEGVEITTRRRGKPSTAATHDDVDDEERHRRRSANTRKVRFPNAAELWRNGMGLEQSKVAAAARAAAAAQAGRRARAAEGRKPASVRDPTTREAAASALVDPCTLSCSQLMESDGGAFGCILPAGHEGAHVLGWRGHGNSHVAPA